MTSHQGRLCPRLGARHLLDLDQCQHRSFMFFGLRPLPSLNSVNCLVGDPACTS